MKKINKYLSILLLGTAICTLSTINPRVNANAAWKQNSTGWWYSEGNSYVKGAWRYIDEKWYYFDNSGYMKTGWLKDGSDWYYLDISGAMQTGWVKHSDNWYYLEPYNGGKMASNIWMNEGYHLNKDGIFDKSAKYLRKDVFRNDGTSLTELSKVLLFAGDPGALFVINEEPTIPAYWEEDECIYNIGLNTLNLYDSQGKVIDKVVIE